MMRAPTIAALIFGVFLSPSAQASIQEAMTALSHNPEQEIILEGAVLIGDLRDWTEYHQRAKTNLKGTSVEQAINNNAVTKALGNFDLFGTLDALAQLAQPNGKPAPAAVALYTLKREVMWAVYVQVQPDFASRMHILFAQDPKLGWEGQPGEHGLLFSHGKHDLHGYVRDDGWLVLSLKTLIKRIPNSGIKEPLFVESLRQRAHAANAALFVRGGGFISHVGSRMFQDGPTGMLLASLDTLLITHTLRDKSEVIQVSVELPAAKGLASLLRPAKRLPRPSPSWPADTLTAVTVDAPTHVAKKIVDGLWTRLKGQVAPPRELVDAFLNSPGTISWADFGYPNDWGIALSMHDGQSAEHWVTTLRSWLHDRPEPWGTGLQSMTYDVDNKNGFELKPHPALKGPAVFHHENYVYIVMQPPRAKEITDKQPTFIDGPITPTVRKHLNTRRVLQLYSVLPSDDRWFALAGWLSALASATASQSKAPPEFAKNVEEFLAALPLVFAAMGINSMNYYDVAAGIDIDDSLLTLEVAGSQL